MRHHLPEPQQHPKKSPGEKPKRPKSKKAQAKFSLVPVGVRERVCVAVRLPVEVAVPVGVAVVVLTARRTEDGSLNQGNPKTVVKISKRAVLFLLFLSFLFKKRTFKKQTQEMTKKPVKITKKNVETARFIFPPSLSVRLHEKQLRQKIAGFVCSRRFMPARYDTSGVHWMRWPTGIRCGWGGKGKKTYLGHPPSR